MGSISTWLTAQGLICILLLAAIRWMRGNFVWASRPSAAGRPWWPPGWPAWSKWLAAGYLGYAFIQWARTGGASPLGITAVWMFVYGSVLLLSMYLLTTREEPGLDTPGDSAPRA
jgi:hypothetical protein